MKTLISFMNYDPTLLEKEFERKADCGYELCNLDVFFAYYKKTNSKDMEFLICYSKKDNNLVYNNCLKEGWHTIKTKNRVIISKEKDCLSNNDNLIITQIKKEQRKALWLNLIVSLFFVLLIIIFYAFSRNSVNDSIHILYLLPSAVLALLLFAIILLFEYKDIINAFRKYIICILSGLLWIFILGGIVLLVII